MNRTVRRRGPRSYRPGGRGGRGRGQASLAAVQWRLADEVVALGEALRVADRPLEVADALLVLAMRACRELMEATPGGRLRLERAGATPVTQWSGIRTRSHAESHAE
jgi:hypothetical protein